MEQVRVGSVPRGHGCQLLRGARRGQAGEGPQGGAPERGLARRRHQGRRGVRVTDLAERLEGVDLPPEFLRLERRQKRRHRFAPSGTPEREEKGGPDVRVLLAEKRFFEGGDGAPGAPLDRQALRRGETDVG